MVKIPENAKRVFKGKLFEIYQWPQKMFDGSIATFEVAKRNNSVQVIAIDNENNIIMLKEEQPGRAPFLSIPGGIVDEGEKPEESAKRELLEETGMECESIKLWQKIGFGGKISWDSYYYIAKGCSGKTQMKLDPGEKIEVYKVNLEEFFEEIEKEDFRNKTLTNMIFRIKHTPEKLEEFKKLIQ